MVLNDWIEPLPVWIEAVSIESAEDLNDFMDTLFDHPMCLNPTSTFVSTKIEAFEPFPIPDDKPQLLIDTFLDHEPNVEFDTRLDISNIHDVAVPPVKITPSISPVKNAKSTNKLGRRLHHKINVDSRGRDQRRKDKQRGYEKGYRRRIKAKRGQDEDEWIQLETQIRTLLAKRTSVVSTGVPKEDALSCRKQLYLQLLQEEQALQESKALDRCVLADSQALKLYSGGTGPSRTIREQLNGLPSLRMCHTFEFSW